MQEVDDEGLRPAGRRHREVLADRSVQRGPAPQAGLSGQRSSSEGFILVGIRIRESLSPTTKNQCQTDSNIGVQQKCTWPKKDP